jgi:protein translocase SEC61 complex gamma subunit
MKINLNPIPKLKRFYSDSKHIISVSYKPDSHAFKKTLKIVLLGIIILGILGFIIAEIINLLIL